MVLSARSYAENALIARSRPCLNVIYNTHERTPLPPSVINHTLFTSLYPTPALARQRLLYHLQAKHQEGGMRDVAA